MGGGPIQDWKALMLGVHTYWPSQRQQHGMPPELEQFLRGLLAQRPAGFASVGLSLGAQPAAAGAVPKLSDLSTGPGAAELSAPRAGPSPVSPGPAPPAQRERRFPRRPGAMAEAAAMLGGGEAEEGPGSAAARSGGLATTSAPQQHEDRVAKRVTHNVRRTDDVMDADATGDAPGVVCVEVTKGRRRVYRGRGDEAALGWEGFDMVDERVSQGNAARDFMSGYLLPQGFPDSVAPQYASYMGWRGCQYFFGGAMSVFTTRSLLGALGVGGRHAGEAAAAINWVMKDGAGRLGRFLFARWGRALDCELKQFRLAGDLLMEAAAALELVTAAAPRAFLPLACTANLAKNLAAVAASSTRAPIYRTFARQNNLADVTAKGESVANLADIVGTVFGIALARSSLPLVPTFCALSCGYLYASRKEVDSVELPYLNRARLNYTARHFMDNGEVPSIAEANAHEPLLPWGSSQRVVLGARVEEACVGPSHLASTLDTWRGRQYALSFRSDTGKVYVLLRETATTEHVLEAAFHAQYLLHRLDAAAAAWAETADITADPITGGSSSTKSTSKSGSKWDLGFGRRSKGSSDAAEAKLPVLLQETASKASAQFSEFARQADQAGWRLQMTMLNPRETRLRVRPLPGGEE